jgi:hypothetical protein
MKRAISIYGRITFYAFLAIVGTTSAGQSGEGMAAFTPIPVLVKYGATLEEIRIIGAAGARNGGCDSILYRYVIRGGSGNTTGDLCTSNRLTIGYSYLLMRTPEHLRGPFDEKEETLFLIVPANSYQDVPAGEFVEDGYICLPDTYALLGKGYPDDGQCDRGDLEHNASMYRRYDLDAVMELMEKRGRD